MNQLIFFLGLFSLKIVIGFQGHQCDMPDMIAYEKLESCSQDHIKESLNAGAVCLPRDKVIKMPLPNNTAADQLTPTHVVVQRCGGLCSHSHANGLTCIGSKTVKRKVAVMIGICQASGGKCEKSCANVEVEDEVECACGCHLEAKDCLPESKQYFDMATCQCKCRDVEEKERCIDAGKAWKEDNCTCVCSHEGKEPCASNQERNNSTCQCEVKEVIDAENKSSNNDELLEFMKWAYLVIGVLVILNTLTIVALCKPFFGKCFTFIKNRGSHYVYSEPKSEDYSAAAMHYSKACKKETFGPMCLKGDFSDSDYQSDFSQCSSRQREAMIYSNPNNFNPPPLPPTQHIYEPINENRRLYVRPPIARPPSNILQESSSESIYHLCQN